MIQLIGYIGSLAYALCGLPQNLTTKHNQHAEMHR